MITRLVIRQKYKMLHQSHKKLSPPVLSPGSARNLSLDSLIQELPMYNFAIEISCTGEEVAHYLEKYPQLPGVILLDEGIYYGMISRCRFLEFLILPQASTGQRKLTNYYCGIISN